MIVPGGSKYCIAKCAHVTCTAPRSALVICAHTGALLHRQHAIDPHADEQHPGYRCRRAPGPTLEVYLHYPAAPPAAAGVPAGAWALRPCPAHGHGARQRAASARLQPGDLVDPGRAVLRRAGAVDADHAQAGPQRLLAHAAAHKAVAAEHQHLGQPRRRLLRTNGTSVRKAAAAARHYQAGASEGPRQAARWPSNNGPWNHTVTEPTEATGGAQGWCTRCRLGSPQSYCHSAPDPPATAPAMGMQREGAGSCP